MYDVVEQGYLDLVCLREVLKRSYTNHIINLEEALEVIKNTFVKESDFDPHPDTQINYHLGR